MDSSPDARATKPRTACYHCRSLRQRCDRNIPCSRCASQSRACSYPADTNRGRRRPDQTRNKKLAAEALLSRIDEPTVREKVVESLIAANLVDVERRLSVPTRQATQPESPSASFYPGRSSRRLEDELSTYESCSLVSPLETMTVAVTAHTKSSSRQRPEASMYGQFSRTAVDHLIDKQLVDYFSTSPDQRDWDVLSAQPAESTLKLDTHTCDPLTASIIDTGDAAYYFELFFTLRNPLLGILDADLHTPEYVFSRSFTLFSTICALGCAVSKRTKDRLLYPLLASFAETAVKWSVAFCVKSVETIQAIMNHLYWSPAPTSQSDDVSWIRLSHAIQIAREMRLLESNFRNNSVDLHPKAATPSAAQCRRNLERTWLYTFIADKGFGMTTGRRMGVSWSEVPNGSVDWWQVPGTTPTDRVLSGVIKAKGLLLFAFAERRRIDKETPQTICQWHSRHYGMLTETRDSRCAPDNLASSAALPVLAFYTDHSIMVLNADAVRTLLRFDSSGASAEFRDVSRKCVAVASRLLDLSFAHDGLGQLLVGFQNNQFIMICHAAIEILHVLKYDTLSDAEMADVVAKIKAIPTHLERVAPDLPATSIIHLYIKITKLLAYKADNLAKSGPDDSGESSDSAMQLEDWLRGLEGGPVDLLACFDGNDGDRVFDVSELV